MANAQKTSAKNEIRAHILGILEKTLDKVKEGMSEKKFQRNIKKASKMIAGDFKIAKKKKSKAIKVQAGT